MQKDEAEVRAINFQDEPSVWVATTRSRSKRLTILFYFFLANRKDNSTRTNPEV